MLDNFVDYKRQKKPFRVLNTEKKKFHKFVNGNLNVQIECTSKQRKLKRDKHNEKGVDSPRRPNNP